LLCLLSLLLFFFFLRSCQSQALAIRELPVKLYESLYHELDIAWAAHAGDSRFARLSRYTACASRQVFLFFPDKVLPLSPPAPLPAPCSFPAPLLPAPTLEGHIRLKIATVKEVRCLFFFFCQDGNLEPCRGYTPAWCIAL